MFGELGDIALEIVQNEANRKGLRKTLTEYEQEKKICFTKYGKSKLVFEKM